MGEAGMMRFCKWQAHKRKGKMICSRCQHYSRDGTTTAWGWLCLDCLKVVIRELVIKYKAVISIEGMKVERPGRLPFVNPSQIRA